MSEIKETHIKPVILSASRSTDIPAFYSEWLMNRLRAGYSKWINPFNRNHIQKILFDNARVIVFWSKNPAPLIPFLSEIEDMGYNFYFQFTLNKYDDTGLEPCVPSFEERLKTFRQLSEKYGKERVVWRFDPLFISETLSQDDLLGRIKDTAWELEGLTEKLVFSFADIASYRKVSNNLKNTGIREVKRDEIYSISENISQIADLYGLKAATCAESADLERFGIEHNKCIDDELMARLFSEDDALMEFLGYESTPDLFGKRESRKSLKDKGQRKACGCITSKDLGHYNTCRHLCLYCYANSSEEAVIKNSRRHNPQSEMILE